MFKIIAFLLIFLIIIPIWSAIAAKKRNWQIAAFVLMVFFTCTMQMIHIAPLPDWRGSARGFAVTMVDISASVMFLSIFFSKNTTKRFFPPGAWTYLIYYLFCILSVTNAIFIPQWGFEILKMFWMYVYFVAVYNFFLNHKDLWTLIYAICGTVFFMLLFALYQKYIQGGYYQIPSTMPHQNSLSLYVALFGSILLGVMLNERVSQLKMAILGLGVLSTLLLSLFTYSRGGMLSYAMAISLVGLGSITLNGITKQKMSFIGAGVLAGAVLVAIAAPRIIERFTRAPEASANTRVFLALAAERMANDYRFGVGANNFSAHSGPGGKYALELYENTNPAVAEEKPYGGIVETIYLLVAAECGWSGLAALMLWLFYYFVLSIWNTFYLRNAACFGISIGASCGLFANYSQSVIEWSLKQYGNFYQLMLVFALISAIWTRRKILKQRKA